MRATNADVHERMAIREIKLGHFAEASRAAREALRVDANRPKAALVLSQALLHTGELVDADLAAARALELDPEQSDAMLVRGGCAAELGSVADARSWYRRAAEEASGDGAFLLGMSLLQSGEITEAEKWLRLATERLGATEPLLALSSHYWDVGNLEAAALVVREAAALAPQDRSLQFKQRQIALARGLETSGAGEDGDNLEEQLFHAAGLLRGGDSRGAAKLYRDLSDRWPDDASIRVALGESLLVLGDSAAAEAAFQSAIRVEESRSAMVGLGRSLLRQGRHQDGATALARAVRIDPDHVPTRSLLVAACVHAGDLDRAKREASEVSLRSPGSDLDLACRQLLARGGVGEGLLSGAK